MAAPQTRCAHGKPLPKARDRHAKGGQGMNWLRPEKRLAIYLRDGLACCYCGEGIEGDAKLTLDHLTPHCQGGCNCEQNLVTACHRCNSARGSRGFEEFAGRVADYINHGATAEAILSHIATTSQRPLDLSAAKALMAARGGFSKALRG